MVGAVNMLIDVSERKQAEARQMMLLKELNHRVKNNMQMLQALLTTAQRETAASEARNVLAEASRRLAVMVVAQKVLYEEEEASHFTARDLLESVCLSAQSLFGPRVQISVDADEGTLSNDMAIPLALILNELLTNAVKHGINDSGRKSVKVTFRRDGTDWQLLVEDDGPGFDPARAGRRLSSGLGLVRGLAGQLGGSFTIERGRGARCLVKFAERMAAAQGPA
jgi:two-component sensor histidine kinase